jgi:hypothetical protein
MITAVVLIVFGLCEISLADTQNQQQPSFSLHSLIKPLGIATLSCITATFIAGLFRKKLRTKFLKIHLPLAIISLILGLTHGLLVLILWGF